MRARTLHALKEIAMLTIKRVETDDELLEVAKLRYRVYVQEMGRQLRYADHKREIVLEPLDHTARILAAFDREGRAKATVRTNLGFESGFGHYRELYNLEICGPFYPDQVSITTRLLVEAQFRSTPLPLRLVRRLFEEGYSRGICFDFIDCGKPLVPFFQKLGHRQLLPNIDHPEFGEMVPLMLVVRDRPYFESLGSPFAKLVQETELHPSVTYFYTHMLRTDVPHLPTPAWSAAANWHAPTH
jgi:hypothetical protein